MRVMAAGVNFNNVWAALGKPVSVFGYGDHARVGPPHRRLRRLRDRLEGRRGRDQVEAGRRGRDPLQPGLLRGRRGARARPARRARASRSGATRRPGAPSPSSPRSRRSSSCRSPQNLSWAESSAYGLTYFTAYRMLIDQCKLQAGHNVLIWGAAGGLGVFATQLCKAAGANAVGVVSSDEKGELVKRLGAVDYINRNEFAGMMRTRRRDARRRRRSASRTPAASPSGSRRSSATRPTSSSSTSARRPSRPRSSS